MVKADGGVTAVEPTIIIMLHSLYKYFHVGIAYKYDLYMLSILCMSVASFL